jgi:TIR domain
MARIFISHSSKNNAAAIALSDWIVAGGWDEEPFLDLDPESGIAAGERWERALHEAADRCEVVLFLISREWLKSEWCLKEFHLAQKLNKRLLGILIDDLSLSELPSTLPLTWQTVNLASGNDHIVFRVNLPNLSKEEHVTFSSSGLASLKSGLDKAGLDPHFFAWPPEKDPNRTPYPGLRPMEEEDAGIFFGRDGSIISALDRLRGLKERGAPRLFVILGASGAGKSSFLRAGLIPRLSRDETNFLTLPIIRPEKASITGMTGLVHAIEEAFKERGMPLNRAAVNASVTSGVSHILPLLNKLVAYARSPVVSGEASLPALVISIDQSEELFLAEGACEAQHFLALIKELTLTSALTIIALFTIRSDSYERLQTAKPIEGLKQETFPLPPMPRGSYETIIEGPARRLKDSKKPLKIDAKLTQELLIDIEVDGAKDALPLLAFTLERLYREYGADGDLLLDEYITLGRIKGSIQAAVDSALKAADSDPAIPKNESERLNLLRRALIPALAGIDPETRTPRRRVARISEIPQTASSLINCLIEARLLTTDRTLDTGETIIEPAHEALLRQWNVLQGWLEEESATLLSLTSVQQAARDWKDKGEHPDWLSHNAGRLQDAEGLQEREDFAPLITPVEKAYLFACRKKQTESENQELEDAKALALTQKKVAQRTRIGLLAVSVLLLLASVTAFFGFQQANKAKQETEKAEQRSVLLAANAAQSLTEEGDLDAALLLMIDGSRWFNNVSSPDELRIALTKTLEEKWQINVNMLFPHMQVFEINSALLLFNPKTHDIFKLTDSISPPRLVEGLAADSSIQAINQSANEDDVIVLRENFEVERINLITGARRKVGVFPPLQSKPGRVYGKPSGETGNTTITGNGLIVLEFTFSLPDNDDQLTHTQLMDGFSGRILEGDEPFTVQSYERDANGSIYAFDFDKKTAFIVEQLEDRLLLQSARIDKRKNISLRYGNCVGQMKDAIQAKALELIDDSLVHDTICKKVGDKYLLTIVRGTSAGGERIDTLLQPNEENDQLEIREIFSEAVEELSGNDFSWVDVQPETGAIAALLNRDVMVVQDGSLELEYRQPITPSYARFAGSDRLIVVEEESGRIVEHTLGEEQIDNVAIFSTSTNAIIGTEDKRVSTLNHGNCVGNNIPRENYDVMPDGRKIVYETTHGSGNNEIRVLRGQDSIKINLESVKSESVCIQFSGNWKEMLIVEDQGVGLYDFDRVLKTASLEKSKIGMLSGLNIMSAFFVPGTEDVVTSDGSNKVLRWKRVMNETKWQSIELYHGENPIFYAEPDANGRNLIILEWVGEGVVHGLLYSVASKQEWFDLGSEYKWLGAAFNDKQEVVVSMSSSWTNVFPMLPLNNLVELAKEELSDWCIPKNVGDYRSSPCWPSAF